jgi:hypothetical protein
MRILSKLQNWLEAHLSPAGYEMLIGYGIVALTVGTVTTQVSIVSYLLIWITG